MKRKIPLAWLQLTREKTRLLVALGGIAFADILMFMQIGFKDALFEGNVRFHQNLDADIVLINPRSNSLVLMRTFPKRRLYQALTVEEVKSVAPIYLEFGEWKNPKTHEFRNIFVFGFNPDHNIFKIPGVQQNISAIKTPDVVLFDKASRKEFGPVADEGAVSRAAARGGGRHAAGDGPASQRRSRDRGRARLRRRAPDRPG